MRSAHSMLFARIPALAGLLRHAVRAAAVGALAGLSSLAAAGPDLGQVVSRMPITVDFVAAIDNGAALRKDLHGSPLMLAISTMRRPAAVIDAWTALAGDLGMTDAEAFDLLLGQRVIIVGSELQADDEGQPRWAILSELDPETERRLRTTLKAVPRRIVAGQPVLEFEHGSFLLATSSGRLRCTPAGTFDNTPASSIMLLAPASDRELFEQMLPLLRCSNPERTLLDLPAGRMVESWQTRDALVVWRLPDPLGSPNRFIGATFGADPAGWRIEAMAYPADGWTSDLDISTIARWSPALLGTLPPGAALAMMGSREAVHEARGWIDPLLRTSLPDPRGESFDRLLGRRSMLAVWLREQSSDGTPALQEPEVLLAMDTPDLARLALRADAFMEEQLLANAATPLDHESLPTTAPNARQTAVPLALSDVRSLTFTEVDQAASSSPPVLSWTYVPEAEAHRNTASDGWWVMHYLPDGQSAETVSPTTTTPALQELGALPARNYLHVGCAMPSVWSMRIRQQLVDTLATQDDDDAAINGSVGVLALNEIVFSHVRSASWAVWHARDDNLLRAEVRLELGDNHPLPE
ncbi:MAG: hypothetical protein Q9O74_01090 [Planctomycetota bacterium]|nr:hypothetical protein [Planctomycetota bacterium]